MHKVLYYCDYCGEEIWRYADETEFECPQCGARYKEECNTIIVSPPTKRV